MLLCIHAQVTAHRHGQGTEKLLSVLGNLARLQNLVMLQIIHRDGLSYCQPESFAELTANSKLDTLIVNFRANWAIEASTAWEHAFASGRHLSAVSQGLLVAATRTPADVRACTC